MINAWYFESNNNYSNIENDTPFFSGGWKFLFGQAEEDSTLYHLLTSLCFYKSKTNNVTYLAQSIKKDNVIYSSNKI